MERFAMEIRLKRMKEWKKQGWRET